MATFPNTKLIPLSQGKFAIVDDEDYDWLMQWKWNVDNCGYARRTQHIGKINGKYKSKTIKMHHIIMPITAGLCIDHINRNTLDNRRCNLRICTRKDNSRNQNGAKNSTSKYKGVSWFDRDKNWRARIMVNYVGIYLGYFKTQKEAARAYNKAAEKYHGEFACLNIL